MKQLIKYPGSKWNIASWIIQHFPSHKVYCEPFFGSGGVFFTKTPSFIETINDIDGDIVNLFKVCRERPEELSRMIELTPWSRAEYIACADPATNEVERARRTIVRFKQSHSGCNHLKSWRSSQSANSPSNTKSWNELPELIIEVCNRLKEAQIENRDALKIIECYNNADSLIYLDPPYPLQTRNCKMYKSEMSDESHYKLLDIITKSKAAVCISSYENDLYNTMLKDWYKDSKSTIALTGDKRTEVIYMNYQPPILSLM